MPAIVALVAALLGLLFAWYSTTDYAQHLDRRLHDVHCSVIPGASRTDEAEACRAAMYSPYSALLKDRYWGGVPISLFALGAFSFFAGFAIYLLVAGRRAPRLAVLFFAAVSVTPLIVSAAMATLSALKLGAFCQTCVGIYLSSALLAAGGLLGLRALGGEGSAPGVPRTVPGTPFDAPAALPAPSRPELSRVFLLAWSSALAAVTMIPAFVYTGALPDHRPYLQGCGALQQPKEPGGALIQIPTKNPVQAATLFEDPLCPTCKAFHDRLVVERVYDRLGVTLVLFPLDTECNWMLDAPLHPGACLVSRAVICGGEGARRVLEWAYSEQEYLTRAGKAGDATLREVIRRRWGEDLVQCLDAPATKQTLNRHLHFAAENKIPVSTPQMYLGTQRFCDEDTDIGLRYTLAQLAPEVLQ